MRNTEYLRVGVVVKPHGVKGEVNVYPTTDDLNRFSEIDTVQVDLKGTRTEYQIEGVKYFKGMAILKLRGVSDMDTAEKLRNAELYIHRSQSSPCKEGEYFICDLIDMEVVTESGEKVGVVTDVLTTYANSVIVVKKSDGKELLLPKIPSCVLNVDVESQKMTVYVLPGLED